MESSRLNILVSAHELNPYGGSECAEGWNVVTRLGKYHNITVLYASGSQFDPFSYENAIKDYFTKNKNTGNINFIAIPQTRLTSLISYLNKKITGNISSTGNPFLYYLGYSLWEKKAYAVAKELCSKSKFDIIHHLTSISFREPGYLWKLDIPFVWGPTGGLSRLPFQFYKYLGYKAYSKEFIRNSINHIQFFSHYRIRKALQNSSLIYTFSKEDELLFSKRSWKKPKILLDAATYSSLKNRAANNNKCLPLKAVWCGELIQRKSLDIILYAINSAPELKDKIVLKVIGAGPLEQYYKSLTETLELGNNVEWIGKVDRNVVFDIMNDSDLLVHSSYREATSHVVPEALSHGLPVVCHDINGMSIAVTNECGIKIPLTSPEKSIEGFKEALIKLANNHVELNRLKIGAIKRAKELSWDKMVETIARDYITIHNTRKQKN
ncbi:MAG TPA: glycosyltransferase family 4 protein [Ignavibacteriaceae bacterium]|nr:glycosyltransferase family 4 protein [Ignavibacteriaceae bacterium]